MLIHRRGLPCIVLLAAVALAPAAAGADTPSRGAAAGPGVAAAQGDTPSPGAAVGSVPAVRWARCPRGERAAGLQCARYRVPLRYDAPGSKTVTLALTRRRATGPGPRLGSLFLNPGGPGGSGTDLPGSRRFAVLARRFDLIGFDPRGTGKSTPRIRCRRAAGLAGRFDAALARPDRRRAPRAALREGARFARSCAAGTGRALRSVGTEYAARDLDRLRAAVGDEQLTYLGFSYGTYLGTVYADAFPSRVRALVLDGALDPTEYGDDFLALLRRNYRASEAALGRFLAWCASARRACRFGDGEPRRALRRLLVRLDRDPLRDADRPASSRANGYTVVYALYLLLGEGRRGWPQIGRLLTSWDRGRPVLTNADLLGILGIPSPNVTIECTDSAGGVTRRGFLRHARRSWDLAPTFGPALVSGPPSYDGANGAACASWPVRRPASDWRGDFRAQGAAPILVVGTTGDPSTPYAGAVALARTLERARLLTFVGEGHTAYGTSACVRRRVDAYLIDGALPAPGAGSRCADDVELPSASSRSG